MYELISLFFCTAMDFFQIPPFCKLFEVVSSLEAEIGLILLTICPESVANISGTGCILKKTAECMNKTWIPDARDVSMSNIQALPGVTQCHGEEAREEGDVHAMSTVYTFVC